MQTPIKIIPNPYKDIASLEDGIFQFSFPSCVQWLEKVGQQLFGSHFSILEDDHELILKLLVYAIGDENSCKRKNISLKKGILLTGPIGCGKTSLMTLVNSFFPKRNQFQMKSSREISFEFEKEGYSVINYYSIGLPNQSANILRPRIFCFDDLGIEQPQKYYGNECNVMAEILLSRYDLFIQKGLPTHLTTNLSASELESLYGNRIRSRMREIFNLIAFDKNSKDKRI